MYIFESISFSDIMSVVMTAFVVIGGGFAYFKWRKLQLLKRAEYINELLAKIRLDKDISKVVYVIDYDEIWYDEYFHNGGDVESCIDKSLAYFSYICYLRASKLISKNEFGFFEYQIRRILGNNQLQNYFYNLYHFSSKNGARLSFYHLFKYGEKIKVFDKDFYNKYSYKESIKYSRKLNF